MKYYYLVFLVVVFSCTNENLNLELFNISQKNILNEILEKNDSSLTKAFDLNQSSIEDVYYNHLKSLNEVGLSEIPILFIKDKSYLEGLYNVNLISRSKIKIYKTGEKINKFNLNLNGEYIDFLEFIAKSNDLVFRYLTSIKSSGGLSPVSTKLILSSFKKKDLKNDNIRLIVCIHFLLINNS